MRQPGRATWVVAAVLAAGCAFRRPVPSLGPPVSAETLFAPLAARRVAITSLRARARVKSGLARLWVREALLVRRPDAVRMDVLSPMGLALAVGTISKTLWAYPPADGIRYEGAATPGNFARLLGAPVDVPDLIDILLGLPPHRDAVAPPDVEAVADGEYRVDLRFAEGAQTLWFATASHALLRVEESRTGAPLLRVSFTDYRDGMPHGLEVSAPDAGRAVSLTYDTVEPNAVIDPALFAPPPASQVLPLEAIRGPG
jgi:hypothetical protein